MDAYKLLSFGRNDIKLKITGNGQLTEQLKQKVSKDGLLDVEFLGVLSREDLVKAYRTADVFVSAATGGEGFGRTLAEAMATGTLTVGTDIEGYREVIGPVVAENKGFASMAKPHNPEDLARKIAGMINLPDDIRYILGREASAYVKNNFSWDIIADQTVEYYDQVLIEHGRYDKKEWPERQKIERGWKGMPKASVIFSGK